jgi:hypothetical protein
MSWGSVCDAATTTTRAASRTDTGLQYFISIGFHHHALVVKCYFAVYCRDIQSAFRGRNKTSQGNARTKSGTPKDRPRQVPEKTKNILLSSSLERRRASVKEEKDDDACW